MNLLLLVLSILLSSCNDRWKFHTIYYHQGKVLYTTKVPGMLVGEITHNYLFQQNINLYDFFVVNNGFNYSSNLLNKILNMIYFVFIDKQILLKYYWATQTVNGINFSEIAIALFNKLPKHLLQDEIYTILFILNEKITKLTEKSIVQLHYKISSSTYAKIINQDLHILVKKMYNEHCLLQKKSI